MRRNITTVCSPGVTTNCCDSTVGYCCARPMVTIKDNWGWCSIRPDYLKAHPTYTNLCTIPENWIPANFRICARENEEVVIPCGNYDVQGNDGLSYGTVLGEDSKCWLDRNLGASNRATAQNDSAAYGDYYEWGRGYDGHQKKTSLRTNVKSDNPTDGKFIIAFTLISGVESFEDWRLNPDSNLWNSTGGTNNPCPAGFRVPTLSEWTALGITNNSTAFSSVLRLPAAYIRNHDGSHVDFLSKRLLLVE